MSLRNRNTARTNPRNACANLPLREIREDVEETLTKINPNNLKSLRGIKFDRINQRHNLTNDSEEGEEEGEEENKELTEE